MPRVGTPPPLGLPLSLSSRDRVARNPIVRETHHRFRVSWLESTEGAILFVALGLRLLLLPSYHSTDMEVHRNWLAITHSLPLSEWYFDQGSEWTLDYPPFFAWFQWVLAQPARILCPALLQLDNLNYAAWPAKLYLRSTVIVSELVYVAAVWALARRSSSIAQAEPDGLQDDEMVVAPSSSSNGFTATPAAPVNRHSAVPSPEIRDAPHQLVQQARWTPEERRAIRMVLFASLLLHPGLIFVDHIHFQYNGFLFGVLFWSFWATREVRFAIPPHSLSLYHFKSFSTLRSRR